MAGRGSGRGGGRSRGRGMPRSLARERTQRRSKPPTPVSGRMRSEWHVCDGLVEIGLLLLDVILPHVISWQLGVPPQKRKSEPLLILFRNFADASTTSSSTQQGVTYQEYHPLQMHVIM